MDYLIKSDLFRYGGLSGVRGFWRGLLSIPGFRYMYYFRLAGSAKHSLMRKLYRIVIRRLSFKYGFQIPVGTKIGEGFYIGHFGTIVINVNSKIGDYCNIAHNVTIGKTNRGPNKGCPTIGDYVWIGTGSVIVGNIKIGNNVLIAPNSYINFDVPDRSIVIGNSSKIVERENPTQYYIEHILRGSEVINSKI